MDSRKKSSSSAGSKSNAAISESFIEKRIKGEKYFQKIIDLPEITTQYEDFFEKAFKTYSKLWKMQQQYRDVLEGPPVNLKRWEIGEIASRIGQLYYIYYLKTSDINYLNEAYTFYSAIRARSYFKTEGISEMMLMTSLVPSRLRQNGVTSSSSSSSSPSSPGSNSAKSHATIISRDLRYQARFLMVCLLLGMGDDVIEPLLTDLGLTLVKYKTECRPALSESAQWKGLIEEVKQFLARRSIISIREDNGNKIPLLESGRLRPLALEGFLRRPAEGACRLGCAVLVGNKRRNAVKVSELQMDVLRMAHSLELSYRANQQVVQLAEARGIEPFRNPQKSILYQCSPQQFHAQMALAMSGCMSQSQLSSSSPSSPSSQCGCASAVYLYVSADPAYVSGNSGRSYGKSEFSENSQNSQNSLNSLKERDRDSHHASSEAIVDDDDDDYDDDGDDDDESSVGESVGLRMGRKMCDKDRHRVDETSNVMLPEDILPYTRVPMLVVIEAEAAEPFLKMRPTFGQPFLCLAAPKVWESAPEPGLFTLFLHRPVAAFCILCGLFTPEKAIYEQCTIIINDYFARLKEIIASYGGEPSFFKLAEDEFLSMFICRYIFCYATLSQHKPSVARGSVCMPASNPLFPESLFTNKEVLSVVHKLAALLGVSVLFNSTSSVLLPRARSPAPRHRGTVSSNSNNSNANNGDEGKGEFMSPSICPVPSKPGVPPLK